MVDNTLYVSGQIGFDPKTMEVVGGGIEAETSQALVKKTLFVKIWNCWK